MGPTVLLSQSSQHFEHHVIIPINDEENGDNDDDDETFDNVGEFFFELFLKSNFEYVGTP